MRIALVVPGGVDRSLEYRVIPALLALIERLARKHDVEVIALNQEPRRASWQLAGARIHNIGSRYTRLRAIRAILELNRRSPFDVVQAVWSGSPGLVATVAGRILGIPSLVHVAGGELEALPGIGYGGSQTMRGRFRERRVLRAAAAVTAASDPMVRAIARLGIRAHRVPLGVDLAAWPPRDPVRRESARPARLIHVASLNRVKDQPMLLRALEALEGAGARFEMDIIGEDTLQGEIQAMAERLGFGGNVRFRGFMTQRELRPLVEAADLLVLSSRHEAGPLVALEAAVAGVPTVGTAVGHIAEWAPHAAIAVPIGNSAALAAAIRRVLGDEDLRMSLAREAQRRAIEENADATADEFVALYSRLIQTWPVASVKLCRK